MPCRQPPLVPAQPASFWARRPRSHTPSECISFRFLRFELCAGPSSATRMTLERGRFGQAWATGVRNSTNAPRCSCTGRKDEARLCHFSGTADDSATLARLFARSPFMAETKPQTLANHTRWDPPFHFFILPIFALGLILRSEEHT